ncbi:hypothetical protein DPMN_169504 [Dreissena polymorpha]|uniref:Uncharacterized protein n=1 Tax=Dreissena polymorpha TaxID=45954 RepID=A0A9D4IDF6_DREPO|nr:hypothetical protein DPMN_169504 [Dreissena polymorpha]
MLGFSASSYYVDAYAVAEERYAMIKNLACNGNENHLHNCSYSVPSFFNKCHSKSTRILCVECGRLNVSNGYVQSYDYTTNTATVRCHTDIPRTVQYICNRTGSWTSTSSCRPIQIQGVRLVGINSTLLGGTVELKINNVWGTICDTGLGRAERQVLCRMMNYRYAGYDLYDYNTHSNVGFGPGSGPIHMESLRCSGSEKDISECAFTTETTCSHSNDAGVVCGGTFFYETVNISGIRLVNGSSQFNGVLELLHDGVWRSLCGHLNQPIEMCSTMNMTYIDNRCCAKHEHRSGLIFGRYLHCASKDAFIGECRYENRRYMRHLRDGYCDGSVILLCSECPKLNVSRGNLVYSEDGTTANLICSEGYFSNITAFRCQSGKWSANNVECVLIPSLNVTHVRLADGPNTNAGRLEITVNNAFGTICANEFSYLDGDIACKSINLRYRAAAVYNGSFFGPGTGPIYIDQLDCTSDRTSIKDCLYRTTGVCNHSNDVSLVCNECGKLVTNLDDKLFLFNDSNIVMYGDCSFYKSYFGQLRAICENGTWKTIGNCIEYSKPLEVQGVRLVNGSNPAEGRVEIKGFDTWGTVCSDDFGIKEAEVICRMLGYLHAKSVAVKGSYGIGSGPIFIDELNCGDDASHINDCEYNTYHNCSHEHDVSVICTDCDNVEIHEGRIQTYPVMTTVNASLTFSCNEGFALIGADIITCELSGKWSSSPPECTKKSNLTLILGESIGSGIMVVMAIIAVSVVCFMHRRNLTLSNIFRKSKDMSVTTNPNTYVSSLNRANAGADRTYVNSGMDSSTEEYVVMDDITHPDEKRETDRPKSAKTTFYETLSDATRAERSDDYSAIDHASANVHSAGTSSRVPKPKGNRTLPN